MPHIVRTFFWTQGFKLGDSRGHNPELIACSPKTSSNASVEFFCIVCCDITLHTNTHMIFHHQSLDRRRVTESVSHNIWNLLSHEKLVTQLSSIRCALLPIHTGEPKDLTISLGLLLIKQCCHQVFSVHISFEISFHPTPDLLNKILLQYCKSLLYRSVCSQETSYRTFYGISSMKNTVERHCI